MTAFNVMAGGRTQVLVDEQQLQQMAGEMKRLGGELDRLKTAMETLSAVNAPANFMAAAMALCNELASRSKAERVGIGFLRGRYVRLKALSHTEKITRNMQLVQDIEGAMEECLDQDVEVIFPPPKDATFVYRTTEILASRHGNNTVISLPLRRANPKEKASERYGTVVAVLTMERKVDKPFSLAEIETLRLTCDLFTARLVDLYEHDRWPGARALRQTRRVLAWAVGAKNTWAKVAAIAASGFIAFALLVDGKYRVEAPFALDVIEKQVISAPFDGKIESVNANIGDMVFTPQTAAAFDDLNAASPLVKLLPVNHPPAVLATLETTKLVNDRATAQARVNTALARADVDARGDASKKGDEAQAQVDRYEAQISAAEVALIDWQIQQATIKSPVDGVILKGDLKTKIGAPLRTGDEMYTVGQLDKLRAELSVPEDQRSELYVGQHGWLKATSYPDRPIGFTIESIQPMATVSPPKNVFKVRVTLDTAKPEPWMSPGVEGLAKVDIGKARYAWIWTHRMVNWVRMKLWL